MQRRPDMKNLWFLFEGEITDDTRRRRTSPRVRGVVLRRGYHATLLP